MTMSHSPFTLILGGARSGKSSHAERLAAEAGDAVLYVATAQAWDDEMRERITRHRADRPANWQTVEAPTGVAAAIAAALARRPAGQPLTLLLDCLTLLASNVIIALPESCSEAEATAALMAEIAPLEQLIRQTVQGAAPVRWLVVSNEVGLGLVPPYKLGRLYRDALGRANQRLAAAADRVLFLVAGLPMIVK
jgi:adenosylcobinamide kinase/adenosylcobinamide-phosphate guanylyltransferase